MPEPEGHDEGDPGEGGVADHTGESPHGARSEAARDGSPERAREAEEERRHRSTQPEQRRHDEHEKQVLDHVRLEQEVTERVERGAEGEHERDEAGEESQRPPGVEALGHAERQHGEAAPVEGGRGERGNGDGRLEAPRGKTGSDGGDGVTHRLVPRGRAALSGSPARG